MNEAKISQQENLKAPRGCFPEDVTRIEPNATLTDPFKFFDPALGTGGRVVTREDWLVRREEIKDLAQYYYFGYKQPTPQTASKLGQRSVEVPETKIIDRKQVTEPGSFAVSLPEGSYNWDFSDFSLKPVLSFRSETWGTWEAHRDLLITIPAHTRIDSFITVMAEGREAEIKLSAVEVPVKGTDTALDGPFPAMIVIGGLSKEQITTLKQNGYAYISMDTGSVFSDNAGYTGAYTTLYPKQAGVYAYDSGSLMGWTWGVSRIIDALLNDPSYNIDGMRTAVTGCSRNGKAALLAAAFDERISVAVPCDPGATGLTGFRYLNEGRLLNYNTYNEHCEVNRVFSRNEKPVNTVAGNGYWLSSKAQDFVPDNVEHFPFDMHEIAALVAPRPMIAFSGENFEWLNSVSTALTMAAAREVYDFLGAGDNAALVVRDGAHANQDRDLPFIIAVMDKTFGRAETLSVKQHKSLMRPEGMGALDGNGVIYPEKTYPSIAAMDAVPYELDSAFQRWSRPGRHVLWTETELVTDSFAYDITAHSDAPRVRLTLPGGKQLTEDVSNGTAVFKLSPAQVTVGRYRLEALGSEKDAKAVFFQGFSLSDALRHGLNLVSTSPDGMSVGFTSRLVNSEAIKVFIKTGTETKRLETGFVDGLTPVYLEAYGVSLKQRHIPEGPFVLILKNLALEALPGCVFELSVDLVGVRTANMFAGGALEGRAQSPQGEKPTWNASYLKSGPIPEWPLYPAGEKDTGERPDFVPTVSAFHTSIYHETNSDGSVTLYFSTPANPNEFGIGFDRAVSWTAVWAPYNMSVTIRFETEARGELTLYLFRLADKENNMIPGPFVVKLLKTE